MKMVICIKENSKIILYMDKVNLHLQMEISIYFYLIKDIKENLKMGKEMVRENMNK